MKVSHMIEILRVCDPDAEIKVLFPFPNRPTGGTLESVFAINPVIDQDSNKVQYAIDTGIGEEGRYKTYIEEKQNK